jgi:hypothetical protein
LINVYFKMIWIFPTIIGGGVNNST